MTPPIAGAVAGNERLRRRIWEWSVANEAGADRSRREGPAGGPAATAAAATAAPIEGGLRGVAAAEHERRRHEEARFRLVIPQTRRRSQQSRSNDWHSRPARPLTIPTQWQWRAQPAGPPPDDPDGVGAMAGAAGRLAHQRCRRNGSNGGRGPVACRAVFSWLARAAVTQATPFSLFFFSGTMRTKTTERLGCGGARRRGEAMRTSAARVAGSGK